MQVFKLATGTCISLNYLIIIVKEPKLVNVWLGTYIHLLLLMVKLRVRPWNLATGKVIVFNQDLMETEDLRLSVPSFFLWQEEPSKCFRLKILTNFELRSTWENK